MRPGLSNTAAFTNSSTALSTPQDLVHLLGRVAQKDKTAFTALYSATSAKLYGIIFRILLRRDLADEVMQEVYVKVWDKAADFDPTRASPITWMATIARNRALDEVRRAKPISLEVMPAGFDIAADIPHPLDLMDAAEDYQRLLGCLQGLEPQKREIVVQAYMHGLSREAISQRFAVPVPTIKTWLHRSLGQLKNCLGS